MLRCLTPSAMHRLLDLPIDLVFLTLLLAVFLLDPEKGEQLIHAPAAARNVERIEQFPWRAFELVDR